MNQDQRTTFEQGSQWAAASDDPSVRELGSIIQWLLAEIDLLTVPRETTYHNPMRLH